MSQKITAQVLEKARQLADGGGESGIPVIVTFVAGTDPALLEAQGLTVGQVWKSMSAVVGRLAPEKLADVAALEEVRLIEYGGDA